MKALVYKGKVLQLEEKEFEVHPDYQWVECDDSVIPGFDYADGLFAGPVIVPPTDEELLQMYKNELTNAIEMKAMNKGYRDSLTCLSYINSKNEKWKAEAVAFSEWRDDVIMHAEDTQAKVKNSDIQKPELVDFMASLPEIKWPD